MFCLPCIWDCQRKLTCEYVGLNLILAAPVGGVFTCAFIKNRNCPLSKCLSKASRVDYCSFICVILPLDTLDNLHAPVLSVSYLLAFGYLIMSRIICLYNVPNPLDAITILQRMELKLFVGLAMPVCKSSCIMGALHI